VTVIDEWAEPFLDRLRVRAQRDAKRRAGVPQVVEAHGRQDPRGLDRWFEDALVEHLVSENTAAR
jgi:hypothetical protein